MENGVFWSRGATARSTPCGIRSGASRHQAEGRQATPPAEAPQQCGKDARGGQTFSKNNHFFIFGDVFQFAKFVEHNFEIFSGIEWFTSLSAKSKFFKKMTSQFSSSGRPSGQKKNAENISFLNHHGR